MANRLKLLWQRHAAGLRRFLPPLFALFLLAACATPAGRDGKWYALRWAEQPSPRGPSTRADPADLAQFELALSYDAQTDRATFAELTAKLRRGDVIAYRMGQAHARKEILKGHLNKVGYRVLAYGHLALLVSDPQDPARLVIFSSQSFKGPNIDEGLDTLREQDWDVYRLDQWDRVNQPRLAEFVRLSHEKAGNWRGYDFSGMFGLWNSNLKPATPEAIGHDYICSTVVVAALYYAGLELDAVRRFGIGDLVSPLQVVSSKGVLIPVPTATLVVEPAAAP